MARQFHLSLSASNGGWPAAEIIAQIHATRQQGHAQGNVHFSMKAFLQNYGGIVDQLKQGPYAGPALVPASPWLDDRRPAIPAVTVVDRSGRHHAEFQAGDDTVVGQWVLQTYDGKAWESQVLPGRAADYDLPAGPQDSRGNRPTMTLAMTAISRTGIASPPRIISTE